MATTTLKIQYASDLHLEHRMYKKIGPEYFLEPCPDADLLVLAGDIGYPEEDDYADFLRWCSESWPQVAIIAGNHEYYNPMGAAERLGVSEKEEKIRSVVSQLPNVHYLNRTAFEARPGLWILGCTLWSDVPEEMMSVAEKYMNDYRLIYDVDGGTLLPITVVDTNSWHQRDLAWLQGELAAIKARGEKAVVVTHHLPTPQLIHEMYADNALNCCFATDLEADIKKSSPLAWFCGHSHQPGTAFIGSTKVLLNPCGYPGEKVYGKTKNAIFDLSIEHSTDILTRA